ncbi:MAG: ABC-F family ATP-binding cassette domain-containing protein [Gammaproteobacteria bacterium]|nr:ABC-F family ATP-binding cassette domain-containing protein [Gammaproteobacteria bacterium]
MIVLNQLSMAYGQRLLFMDVTLNFDFPHRYAIVGANGVGKSTLFRLLQNEEEATEGEIKCPKEATIGWLKQDQFKYENVHIRDIVLQGRPRLWDALQERDEILASDDWDDKKGYRLGVLEDIIMHEDGYTADSEAEQMLLGLGITADYFDKPLSSLSGGYKLRVLLAQTLFQRPTILLLDEPTNHLDIVSIAWFESFLKNEFKGLVLFISHDVEFVNRVAEYIVDIDFGDIRQYRGDYKRFLAEKALVQEQKQAERKSLESKIGEMQRFVDRFKAKASKAAQARSRMKMIEKIEVPDVQQSSRVAPVIRFTPKRPSGKSVIKVSGLCKSYQDKLLFKDLNIEINRSERVAILGGNGLGKSTLMKMMLGLVQPDEGSCTFGHEVHRSYFSQDHHELLNTSISAFDWLRNAVTEANEQQVRGALAQVLFTKDEAHKNILTLSGGEAARLLLAKVMLDSPNLIFLDEPTNHLDLETIEVLAHALKTYHGTVVLITHNRYLIDEVAMRTIYLEGNARVKDEKIVE